MDRFLFIPFIIPTMHRLLISSLPMLSTINWFLQLPKMKLWLVWIGIRRRWSVGFRRWLLKIWKIAIIWLSRKNNWITLNKTSKILQLLNIWSIKSLPLMWKIPVSIIWLKLLRYIVLKLPILQKKLNSTNCVQNGLELLLDSLHRLSNISTSMAKRLA